MTTFTIDEMTQAIREEVGIDVTARTVRYYIAEGVLRRPDERGKFTQAHLDRLKLILKLKQAFLPIPEIRKTLQSLQDSDVATELSRYDTENRPPASNLAAEYTRRLLAQRGIPSAPEKRAAAVSTAHSRVKAETWERITLAPSIEIHVRQPLSQDEQIFLDALLDYAQTLRKP